jgi:hypothetical protein
MTNLQHFAAIVRSFCRSLRPRKGFPVKEHQATIDLYVGNIWRPVMVLVKLDCSCGFRVEFLQPVRRATEFRFQTCPTCGADHKTLADLVRDVSKKQITNQRLRSLLN